MTDAFDASKEDFNSWVDKWDKALEAGIFKDTPKIPSTAPQTSQDSFFGLQQTNPTDSINSSDADYWRAINSVADGGVEVQRIDEAEAVSIDLPNPIRHSTEGEDQKLSPEAINATFDEEDIKSLEEMKLKLYDLETKVAAMEDKQDYQAKIKSMIEKISEISDKMSRPKK